MPYSPTSWVDGTTMGNQSRMNNLETQYTEATNSLEQDLLTAFVFSGMVATKDGVTATQLDVTAGIAFLRQTDSTLRRRAPLASTASQYLTAAANSTYYLDLNPDGTTSWATTHSAQANYLTICTVATDASGNILTVTDTRVTATTLLSGMTGQLNQAAGNIGGLYVGHDDGSYYHIDALTAGTYNRTVLIRGWNGTTQGLGKNFEVSPSGIFAHGTFSSDDNGFGTPLILSDGAGHLTAVAFHGPADSALAVAAANVTAGALPSGVTSAGAVIATVGAHSNLSTTVEVSVGSGIPAALATNEVYFQLS